MKKITPGEIFNICDDVPSQSDVVVNYVANLMNIKNIQRINFDSSKLNEKTKSFYLDNKKVKNNKIKKILDWTPKFRNYKLGLDNLFNLLSNENNFTNTSISKKINGGVERGTLDIAKELAVKNFKSVIISAGGEMAEKYKYKGVDHHTLQIEKKGFFNFFSVRAKFEKNSEKN